MMILRCVESGRYLRAYGFGLHQFTNDPGEALRFDDAPCERYRDGPYTMEFVPVATTGGKVVPLATRSTQPPTDSPGPRRPPGTPPGRPGPYGAAWRRSEAVEAGAAGPR
jgi:hypothetical protein